MGSIRKIFTKIFIVSKLEEIEPEWKIINENNEKYYF